MDVINFSDVESCGTDTETAVPCMFSAIGRRDYDEDRIRSSESLLHVLRRTGFDVVWRDNNTGCKGVCSGIGEDRVDRRHIPGMCEEGRCLDETLLRGMDRIVNESSGNLFLVLHQMGNHGPAYHNRYPEHFRRFTPTCGTSDLRQCSRQEIVNAYDNALLYTDYLVAQTIAFLKAQESRYDTAMVFVSDHGESLGEAGLYLHGIPCRIAPKVQKAVPMIMWLSRGFKLGFDLDEECLRGQARHPLTHDNLFHSLLGMLRIEAKVLEPALDLSRSCRDR